MQYLITFSNIAERYLRDLGYEPHHCKSEDEARNSAMELINNRQWPCYFFKSDTTGEKDFEEFYTDAEDIDMHKYKSVGVIKNEPLYDENKLDQFLLNIEELQSDINWNKQDIIKLFFDLLPEFAHKETGKYLDGRM